MNIQHSLEQLGSLYPIDNLKQRIDFALKISKDQIQYMIPSIELGTEGLTLSSICLVTEQYICEIRMAGGSFHDFDIMAKNSICNMRFKTWTHEIKEGERVKAKYEIAEVKILHGLENMSTSLSFAGDNDARETWLQNLITAIPVSMVLAFSR